MENGKYSPVTLVMEYTYQTNDPTTSHNNVMHAKPDLRVFLKWMIADSSSVITDVITLKQT